MINAKRQQWRMDSTTFCRLWAKWLSEKKHGDQRFRLFVLDCFQTFSKTNEDYDFKKDMWFDSAIPECVDGNTITWDADIAAGKNGDMAKADQEFSFLKERCYTKMMSIRNRYQKKGVKVPAKIPGYELRNGSRTSTGTDWDAVHTLFFG